MATVDFNPLKQEYKEYLNYFQDCYNGAVSEETEFEFSDEFDDRVNECAHLIAESSFIDFSGEFQWDINSSLIRVCLSESGRMIDFPVSALWDEMILQSYLEN